MKLLSEISFRDANAS